MEITKRTTPEEFAEGAGWRFAHPGQVRNFRAAYTYFVHNSHIPIDVLNRPVHDAVLGSGFPGRLAWGPPSGGPITLLFSYLQGIDMSHPVDPRRRLKKLSILLQFRKPGDPVGLKGSWFTRLRTRQKKAALPPIQNRRDRYMVQRDIYCLESKIADAFMRWVPDKDLGSPVRAPEDSFDRHEAARPYAHGGATQFFVYSRGPEASAILPVLGVR